METKMYCTAIYRGHRIYILHDLEDDKYIGTVINRMGQTVVVDVTSTNGETCKAMCMCWIDGDFDGEE
jgi:hypothetical protein